MDIVVHLYFIFLWLCMRYALQWDDVEPMQTKGGGGNLILIFYQFLFHGLKLGKCRFSSEDSEAVWPRNWVYLPPLADPLALQSWLHIRNTAVK